MQSAADQQWSNKTQYNSYVWPVESEASCQTARIWDCGWQSQWPLGDYSCICHPQLTTVWPVMMKRQWMWTYRALAISKHNNRAILEHLGSQHLNFIRCRLSCFWVNSISQDTPLFSKDTQANKVKGLKGCQRSCLWWQLIIKSIVHIYDRSGNNSTDRL